MCCFRVNRVAFLVFGILVLVQARSAAGEPQTVTGRIVDENGKPMVGVTIAERWRSIEPNEDSVGEQLATLIRPLVEPFVITDRSGQFSFESKLSTLGLLALETGGKRGAIAFRHDLTKPVENAIQLRPLSQVTLQFPDSFQTHEIERIYMTICLEEIKFRPLADTHLVYIDGPPQDYILRLPPGSYVLKVTAFTADKPRIELGLASDLHFEIDGEEQLKLGELQLREYTDPTLAYARKIKALRDRQKSDEAKSREDLFGQVSPRWSSIDGAGLDHQANIDAFRGKWVLLEFWGLNCLPCIKEGIPELIDFCGQHERHRDRFEIVGIYLDFTGKIDGFSSLQKELEPIRKNVWGDKAINFPIVVDNTFSNWERYAIQGLGDCLLVDPSGRIVRGDLNRLKKILDGEDKNAAR